MDAIDEKILKLMGLDSRTTYKKISQETNISEAAIKKRIDKLIKNGVIQRFTIAVDPEKTKAKIRATIDLDIEPNKKNKIIKKLQETNEFYSIWETIGAHNINARGGFENMQHLEDTLEDAMQIEGITGYHSSILSKQKKDRTYVYSKK